MPDWLEEILRALLGNRSDMPGGGTGVGVGVGEGGDAEAKIISDIINEILVELGVDVTTDVTTGDVTTGDVSSDIDVTSGDVTGGDVDVATGDVTTDVTTGDVTTGPVTTDVTTGPVTTDVTTGAVTTGDVDAAGGEAIATSGDVISDVAVTGGAVTTGPVTTDVAAEGGSNILGDILSTLTNTFMGDEAPDLVQIYLAQKYASDALERASEDELAFLRELMGRQDTFQLFRNLGLPIDGEDNERMDFQINQLRDLVNRELDDRYKIQPEIDVTPLIQEVTTIDPSDLGQINVADLLMNLDPGASPSAIDTLVNQIDPFNPEDPALRFLQEEGMRAIESTAAARGRLNTGGTLDELQNRAIGIASQYAGGLADIGRVQDTSQLAADQQFYTQLLGSGREDFGRGMTRYGMVSDAQTAADDMYLEGELARFNSEQKNLAQQYDMSRYANVDALARETQLYNEMAPLIDIGLAGATGLTGNTPSFATAGLQRQGDQPSIYGMQGNLSAAEQLNRRQRNTALAGRGYNALKDILGY